MAQPVTDAPGHDDTAGANEKAVGPPPVEVTDVVDISAVAANDDLGTPQSTASPEPATTVAAAAADPPPAAADPPPAAAELRVYPPDPAGARPKASLPRLAAAGPRVSAGEARATGGGLGQTFRPTGGPAIAAAGTGGGPSAATLSVAADGVPPDPKRALDSPHAPRFQFILGALIALGLSALAITVYTLGSARDGLPTDWSAWHPTATGVGAANQIANHVATEYRLPNAAQLLAVQGGPLVYAGAPVSIAIKTGAAASDDVVLPGNAVLYKMCGLGPGCTIIGKASSERLLLVRREALELALYTFQYIGADQVVVMLPPLLRPTPVPGQPKKVKITADPTNAVFFRSSDLSGELSHPLDTTLTQRAPSVATVDRAPDTAAVSALTSPSFYKFSFVQNSQDNSLFLLLQPSTLGN
jgi:hypothetical protein